ncbi:MAG: FkbM family methyltransferase [Ardenticatenaceae bacterium]
MIGLNKVLKSIRDRSFIQKVLNRLLSSKYVPAPHLAIDHYIANHYPNDGWQSLSLQARKVWTELSPVFDNKKINTIAYVGAHMGDTALALDQAFPGREFYLLEPLPDLFKKLTEKTATHKNMHCLNVAAGSQETSLDMLVDNYAPASSLLPYEPIALQEFPFLGKQSTKKVIVKPLDNILKECKASEIDLLLMDVQGYENEVLQGAHQTLASCKVVISELSLVPLYVGSSTFDSVYKTLLCNFFNLEYLINPIKGTSQQVLQVDGVFIRTEE